MNILVAADGSPYTLHMVDYLAAHPTWRDPGNTFTVMTVVPSVMGRAAAMFDKTTLDEYYHDEAETVVKPLREAFAARGLKARYQSLVGQPAEEITRFAAQGSFDLIVMGSHGHSAFGNMVLGSVASKVLAQCKVPVLLVR